MRGGRIHAGILHPDSSAIAPSACCTHLAAENRPSHEKGALQSSHVAFDGTSSPECLVFGINLSAQIPANGWPELRASANGETEEL